jgi:hypothetical protein
MTYRWQEIIKILIPGFYLLLGVGISYIIDYNAYDKEIVEVIGKFSAILLVLLFFIAFVVGYINEIISGGLEYLMYHWGIPRPSRLILNKSFTRFQIIRSHDLRNKLGLKSEVSVDNVKSAKALAQAKQSVYMDGCQEFYYQSVLSRNLFFAHLFSSIIMFSFVGWSWLLLLFSVSVGLLLCWQWWKMNLVYVKKIFSEYLKDSNLQ